MKKILKGTLYTAVILYVILCVLLYVFQEKFIFAPDKLAADYKFDFPVKFQELTIKTFDKESLNGVLFKADSSKGLIFYLHGNGGCISTWGEIAKTYTDLGYDLFVLDYRGYGKSTGTISSEEQLFNGVLIAYDSMKLRYSEDKIIILGYSLGTGLAAQLASEYKPKHLILQAPYFNMEYMMRKDFPFIPTFLLRYKFETDRYIRRCKMPITIFHGDNDKLIPYECSVELIKLTHPRCGAELIALKGRGHNGMSNNPEYVRELKRVLAEIELPEEGFLSVVQKAELDSISIAIHDSIVKSYKYRRSEKSCDKRFKIEIKVTTTEGDSTGGQVYVTQDGATVHESGSVRRPCFIFLNLNTYNFIRCSKKGYQTKVVYVDTHIPDGREKEEFAMFTMDVELHKLVVSDTGKAIIVAGGIEYIEEEQDFNKVEK